MSLLEWIRKAALNYFELTAYASPEFHRKAQCGWPGSEELAGPEETPGEGYERQCLKK